MSSSRFVGLLPHTVDDGQKWSYHQQEQRQIVTADSGRCPLLVAQRVIPAKAKLRILSEIRPGSPQEMPIAVAKVCRCPGRKLPEMPPPISTNPDPTRADSVRVCYHWRKGVTL